MQDLTTWFEAFTQAYVQNDEGDTLPLTLKIEHSKKVRDEALFLAHAQGFSEDKLKMAEAAGLLHDIGRFPQYARYRTFRDSLSVDHGLLGVRTLRSSGALDSMFPTPVRQAMYAAVACHNRKHIPSGLSGLARELTAIVRDADKLDIARIMLAHLEPDGPKHQVVVLELNPDPQGLTSSVLQAIYNQTNAPYADMVYTNDFCLLLLSWLFDLNSFTARQAYFQRGYVEKFLQLLPISKQIADLRSFIFARFQTEAA